MNKKVFIGMSGGVDSSVAAYLLKEEGYEVVGVTLNLYEVDEDAKKVADYLGIDHITIDKRREFKEGVIGHFIDTYKAGKTPNPCVFCNLTAKIPFLLNEANKSGRDFIATGHYSMVSTHKNGRLALRLPEDYSKDQTYFLYTLSQETLSRFLFPLSKYSKEKVRDIAQKKGIPVHEKKDSQDICFIPDGDYVGFLERETDVSVLPPGDFVDTEGNVLGRHSGIYRYTIGQRKNLGVALGERMYVKALDMKRNQVILGKDEDLFTDVLMADNISYMGEESFEPKKTYMGRIRYSHKGTPCHVSEAEGRLKVMFDSPVRAVTPGQSIVLYEDGYVVGGAVITGVTSL